MAKLTYSKKRDRYEVWQWNPATQQLDLIDHDTDFDAIGIRQGFLSEDDEKEFDPFVVVED